MGVHPAFPAASASQARRLDVTPRFRRLSPWMILAGTLAAFAFSLVYYSIPPLAEVVARLGPREAGEVTATKIAIEFFRTMLLVVGTSWFVTVLRVRWSGAIALGAITWTTFVATQWIGSVMWDDQPIDLAMVHAGDWLGKMVLIAAIAGAWPAKRSSPEKGPRQEI